MATRLAINGFGRTGRSLLRAVLALHPDLEIVAINDLGAPEALAGLFARDSVHSGYSDPVRVEEDAMIVSDRRIAMLAGPALLVSSDTVNSTACVFDSVLTMTHGHMVKVLDWYDKETGYSSRLADLAAHVGAAPKR